MKINERCRECLRRKYTGNVPPSATAEQAAGLRTGVGDILERGGERCAPQLAEELDALRFRLFGAEKDYSAIKRHYNDLMLSLLPHMLERVQSAPDPLERAVQYALAGNYIDFAAVADVDEDRLRETLDAAAEIAVDRETLEAFRDEVARGRRAVYFTDNCGEIVADKLLIGQMRAVSPALEVTVIVRGRPVVNDATMEDAAMVRMEEAARRVLGSGNGMPGNVIGAFSPQAEEEVRRADLLVSKGQGNYEGLSGCGLNIFYLFLCKCDLFVERFHVPRFTGIMTRER